MLNLNQDQQILKLNSEVKTYLGASKIHGVGVFALQTIRKGERAHCFPKTEKREFYTINFSSRNKLFPEIRDLIMGQWASWATGSHFWSPNDTAVPLFFMNHSDNPNYDHTTDLALRDIVKGEELTENYKLMDNWQQAFPWLT